MGFLRSDDLATPVWSVAELTGYIKELFELDYRLADIDVSGEISNFTRARSGHLYFTLKDEAAALRCVMWRSAAERLRFAVQDGDAVVVHGRISVYEATGAYQLYADRIEPAGRGDLALAFERLKEQLAAEGLFDPAHKQPLPSFPRRIGIVTSADAAALRDTLNVLRRRYPLTSVLIAPTLVQGDLAPAQIAGALDWLDGRDDIDVIILARGGGSIEDLWAFSDERVARAIFQARHPIISGVGHETDFTIADFVADVRAPTPSAAAEIAVPDIGDWYPALQGLGGRLRGLVDNVLREAQRRLEGEQQALHLLSPRSRLDGGRQRVDMLAMRLEQAMRHNLERRETAVALQASALKHVSPLATLARGYAIVQDESGRVVVSVAQVSAGDALRIRVADGEFGAAATSPEEPGR